jgi:ribosomal protein S18 acetylase RimI-like enzyme
MTIKILKSKSLTSNTIIELNSLLGEQRFKRLSFRPPNIRQWRRILAQKGVRVFFAREGKLIVGMAMLRWHELPMGKVGTVEDAVVSSKYRRKGYGGVLTRAIIDFAKKKKVAYIDLTSRPERVAANKLWQKFGWKKRQTNVYRLLL